MELGRTLAAAGAPTAQGAYRALAIISVKAIVATRPALCMGPEKISAVAGVQTVQEIFTALATTLVMVTDATAPATCRVRGIISVAAGGRMVPEIGTVLVTILEKAGINAEPTAGLKAFACSLSVVRDMYGMPPRVSDSVEP